MLAVCISISGLGNVATLTLISFVRIYDVVPLTSISMLLGRLLRNLIHLELFVLGLTV